MIDRLQRCVCISFQAKAKTKLPQQVNSQRKTKRKQMSRPWSAASFSTQITNKRRACRTSWTSIVIIRARFKRNRTMYSGFSFRYAPLCTSLQPYIYIYTRKPCHDSNMFKFQIHLSAPIPLIATLDVICVECAG